MCQTEMRNKLLDIGRKVMLAIKWLRICLTCVPAFGKIEIMDGEIAYLAEEISKQNIGDAT